MVGRPWPGTSAGGGRQLLPIRPRGASPGRRPDARRGSPRGQGGRPGRADRAARRLPLLGPGGRVRLRAPRRRTRPPAQGGRSRAGPLRPGTDGRGARRHGVRHAARHGAGRHPDVRSDRRSGSRPADGRAAPARTLDRGADPVPAADIGCGWELVPIVVGAAGEQAVADVLDVLVDEGMLAGVQHGPVPLPDARAGAGPRPSDRSGNRRPGRRGDRTTDACGAAALRGLLRWAGSAANSSSSNSTCGPRPTPPATRRGWWGTARSRCAASVMVCGGRQRPSGETRALSLTMGCSAADLPGAGLPRRRGRPAEIRTGSTRLSVNSFRPDRRPLEQLVLPPEAKT